MAKKTYDLLFKLLLIGVSIKSAWKSFDFGRKTRKKNCVLFIQFLSFSGLGCWQNMHSVSIQWRCVHFHVHLHDRWVRTSRFTFGWRFFWARPLATVSSFVWWNCDVRCLRSSRDSSDLILLSPGIQLIGRESSSNPKWIICCVCVCDIWFGRLHNWKCAFSPHRLWDKVACSWQSESLIQFTLHFNWAIYVSN